MPNDRHKQKELESLYIIKDFKSLVWMFLKRQNIWLIFIFVGENSTYCVS